MGTPDFAVPALKELHRNFGVVAVVTNPDKPQGRGLKLYPSPVKIAAEELSIPVLQPESLKAPQFAEQIKDLQPDIICVIAFKILPKSVYTLAKLGTFNVHGSLLPKYRGAAPIQWSIINGDKETGVTTFLLNDTVDTGSILLQKTCAIEPYMTFGELYARLMPLAAGIAVETCNALITNTITPKPQDDTLSSAAPKIFRENCKIDWNRNVQEVVNFIHGVSPIPAAWTFLNNSKIKIFKCEISEERIPVHTYKIENNHLFIGCKDNSCKIIELQPEGKPKMSVKDFLNGYRGESNGHMS